MRKFFTIAVVAVILGVGFMSLDVQAYTLQVPDFKYGDNVLVQVDGQYEIAGTGEFSVALKDDQGTLLVPDAGRNWFTGFCIEIDQGIEIGGAEILVDLVAPSLVKGGLEAAWLMQTYASATLGSSELAGLQLAIWEVTKDANAQHAYALNSGNFATYSGSWWPYVFSPASIQFAQSYLNSLAQAFDPTGLDKFYRAAQNPEYQDLMIRVSLEETAVPEPGTLLLIGSGLLGLFGIARKR